MLDKLIFIYFLPLLISLFLATPIRLGERGITRLTTFCLILPALTSFYLVLAGFGPAGFPYEHTLAKFSMAGHTFPLIIWIDKYTLAMLGLTHILGLLVIKYSHGYLHLEKGFQRFFSTILFFIFGMYLLSLAGTMDLFFAGWEIVGFSSFLLIAFYRAHNRSVINAWRIYNIYRVCDIGLLLGAVIGHVLWHGASRFSILAELTDADFEGVKGFSMVLISILVIFASLGKSAQFPFHNWPSRAMEGPTPSSAIFYGALSIHAGVFLLIRTYPVWSHGLWTQVLVGVVGVITIILSSFQGRVQANIKGQIAYASTAQIGLMYVALSLGLLNLVIFHLFCHALYRCFQMLVSPSIVLNSLAKSNKTVMRRISGQLSWMDILPTRIRNTLYVLAMNDFSMDISWRGFNFLGWKKIYRFLRPIIRRPWLSVPFVAFVYFLVPAPMKLPLCLGILSSWFSLRALTGQKNAFRHMLDLSFSLITAMLAVWTTDHHFAGAIESYALSAGPILLLAVFITYKFRNCDLRNFSAQGSKHPHLANLFLLSFMVLAGMPISTAFFGEDLILGELISRSYLLAGMVALTMMIAGLVCVKIYTRLFMGVTPAIKVDTV